MKLIGPTPVPSILEQTPWPCGFYHFKDEAHGNEYFNCSVVRKNNRNVLIVRRKKNGWNTLEAWYLKNNRPTIRHPIFIPPAIEGEHWEDPRAINRNGTIIVSFCNFAHKTYAHQAITGIKDDWTAEYPLRVKFGKNGNHLTENVGHEKNWTWFAHTDGRLWFVYSLADGRQVVCKTSQGKVIESIETQAPVWDWGELRGGTPPVLLGDSYWSFMHSSTFWIKPKRRYHMGVIRMESKPPFRITGISRVPILSGSERDYRKQQDPPCVFPCGAIHEDGHWLVTLGMNDCRCAWLKIPHPELVQTLVVV